MVVVITGGTAGVGRATARRFAEDGASVAVLARGQEGLSATAQDIEARGGRALAIACDVSDPDQVRAAAERVEAELGPIDVWINNAMTTVFGEVGDVAPREFRRVTDVTFHGAVWGTMAALAVMRPRDRGVIVQVGSALAYRGIPLQAAYCAAKHAIVGFTDSMRCELAHRKSGIALTMVHLPALDTPQFDWCENKMDARPQPVPPIYQPEVAARAIHAAALTPRREVWVGVPTIEAIIGQKLAPGLLDRYLARRAWSGQITDEPVKSHVSNLYAPVPGDHGVHGRFGKRAKRHALRVPSVAAPIALAFGLIAAFAIARR